VELPIPPVVEPDPVDPEVALVPAPEDVLPPVPVLLPVELAVAWPVVLVLLDDPEDDPALLDPVLVSGVPDEPAQAAMSQSSTVHHNRFDVGVTESSVGSSRQRQTKWVGSQLPLQHWLVSVQKPWTSTHDTQASPPAPRGKHTSGEAQVSVANDRSHMASQIPPSATASQRSGVTQSVDGAARVP
jgi:hypothetical protein